MRIVSLIASATEILCALGLRSSMVGRSHECDYPPDVASLPQCTTPKFAVDGTSPQIDMNVKAILEQALSVYTVDVAMLEKLFPTHIVTQSQCEVCAVSMKDVERASGLLLQSKPRIISLQPNTLEDVWNDIHLLARVFEVPRQGQMLMSEWQPRMHKIRNRTAGRRRPVVAFIEWIEPLMLGGNWMPTLLEIAGARSAFGEEGKHSPVVKWEDFLAADPEMIVVAPCGFTVERARQDMQLLTAKPGWGALQAVKNGKVFIADGNQFFNRPGPRLVESAEILSDMIIGRPAAGRFVTVG